MCTLYTYTNTCMPRFSASGFSIWILWALQVSQSNPWAHVWIPHMQCVYVCEYTHRCTYLHSPPVKNTERTDNTCIFSHVKNNPSHQPATSPLRRLSEHPQPRPPSLINKLHVHGSHVHTLQRVCSQIRTLVLTDTCGAYTLAHAQVLKTFV